MVEKTLLSVLFIFIKCSLGNEVRITNASAFFAFVGDVNTGTNYSGTTIFLDSDLSFSGYTINPVGNTSSYQFRGVFDGQGYVISNFNITKSSWYVGLFGYSSGLIIRNVVLDSSCSITNTYSVSNDVYVGGIIGYCNSNYGQCNIENNVNMANVSFSGSISGKYYGLFIGGIAGELSLHDYNIYLKNCANYGSVTHSGTSDYSYIGGIGGLAFSNYNYIYNCLNYGTITHSGTTSYLCLGGIAGYTEYTYIENCVSAGMISSSSTAKYNYIGSLVGSVGPEAYINYCYYTDKLSNFNMYGYGTPTSISNTLSYNSSTFTLPKNVSINDHSKDSLIEALNAASDYYTLRDYSRWMLNKNNKIVSFTINSRTNPINMDYQVIILPSLASEGYVSFDGWYTNSGCTTPLTSYEVTTTDTSLYGKFEQNTNNYTIIFNTRGGTPVSPIQAQFGTTVSLPSNLIKDQCKIGCWETVYGGNVGLRLTMPARNITLYAVWKCTHIKTTDDFLNFSKVVNTWTSYSGTTIFLDSDLSLIGYSINPIISFSGIFDGQGHVISNFNITKSSEYMGLFGYSSELTIKNIILDSSCSMTNAYSGSGHIYVGGIIGYCRSIDGHCNIENNVNMASVSFSGSISSYSLFIGGIAGFLYSDDYSIYVKNCVNYGSITHSGNSYGSYIGGIVGSLYGSSSNYKYIYNCLNYGTITHSGTTSNTLYLGGIAGDVYYVYIENCVSAGRISSNNNTYVGNLVGKVYSYTYINYTYYTNDVGNYSIYGSGTPKSESNTPNISSDLNSTLITNLNSQVTLDNRWNRWLLNSNNKSIVFKVNNNIGFSLSSQIIILPDLVANNSFVFSGWYTDPYYNTPFRSDEVSESMTLYSLYGVNVTVAFNSTGGNVAVTSKGVFTNSPYGELPTPNMTGHTFSGWFIEDNEKILNETKVTITNNHALYAHWSINNYTITLIFDNGTEPDVRILNYSQEVEYPDDPKREGYTFDGWNNKLDIMPANDTTITALWTINNYTVIFDFNNGTDSEVRVLDYNSSINYPVIAEKEGYTSKWDKGNIKFMPAKNIIVTAQWIAKNYTVFLNVSGGDELGNDEITVTFNDTYKDLPIPTKEGYSFVGWFTEDNENITSKSIVRIASDHILNAHWIENKSQAYSSSSNIEIPTNKVEIIFSTKDLSREEIVNAIKQYTKDEFTIIKFEDTSDGIKVIIEFNDIRSAIEFAENIKSTSNSTIKSIIKDIKYTFSDTGSFSLLFYPFIPFAIFIL